MHRTARGYWVLSRFEDVFQAALDTATYSSAQGLTFEENEIVKLGLKPTLVMMDRPEHSTFRRLISRGFTPRKVAELEPAIRAFVRTRVAILAEAGEADFVEVLAGPLPTFVVATYLGVPEEDRERFGRWSDAIVAANASGNTVRDAAEAVAGLYGYFADLVAWRRQHPGDDMLSDLVAADVGGRPLQLDEILGYCFVMIAGGNDTASGLLAGSAVLLSEHPAQRRLLAGRTWTATRSHRGAAPDDQPGAGAVAHHDPRRRAARVAASRRAARSICCTAPQTATTGSSDRPRTIST